jgi:FHA domain
MIRLQILSGKQAGQTILARRFPFRLGRNPQSDLPLTDSGVWDDHCRIDYRPPEGFFVVPSPNIETRIDIHPVEKEIRLHNAAELSLGAVRLRFTLADSKPRSLALREGTAWLFLLAVLAVEAWLIFWLPR